jgi:hypothetical protein
MKHYELIHSEEYKGFDIKFYAAYEDARLQDCFDETVEDIKEISQKIDDGDYVWFIAKVTASKHGTELAEDYLGGNLYENEKQFVTEDGYYADMRESVFRQAEAIIDLLTA